MILTSRSAIIFLLLLFASSNNRRFSPKYTRTHTILPSISYFYFQFVVCSPFPFVLCATRCRELPCWIAPFQNTLDSPAKDTPPILTDAIFVQSDFPWFFGFPTSFLPFSFRSFPTLVLFVLLTSFPRVFPPGFFFLLFFLASSWWETLYPRNSGFFSFPLSFRLVFFRSQCSPSRNLGTALRSSVCTFFPSLSEVARQVER